MAIPAGSCAGVLPLGDPRLRMQSRLVNDVFDDTFCQEKQRLHSVLNAFRRQYGFGRAVAAPQIGILKRFIALQHGGHAQTLINPEVTHFSGETFTMWDDCMSFPYLLVKVRRHKSLSLRFIDLNGTVQIWENITLSLSELLQHEIDHLDGILAIDRAISFEGIISRDAYDQCPDNFNHQVDYISARPSPV